MTWRQVYAVGSGVLLAALVVLAPALVFRAVENGEATPVWWDVAVAVALLACAVGLAASFANGRDPQHWAGLLVAVTGAGIATFPLIAHRQLAVGDQPWIGLATPLAACAIGVALRWVPALCVGLALAGVQLLAQQSDAWPLFRYQLATDAVYVVVCTIAAGAAMDALRTLAAAVDSAESRAIAASARAGLLDVQRREAARWDAFIHDEVLATLETARGGHADPADLRRLARDALAGLDRAIGAGRRSVPELAELLSAAVGGPVVVLSQSVVRIPGDVAAALVAASVEACRNVSRHTPADTPTEVTLGADDDGLTVRIRDAGPGFEPDRVPRTCLGISVSIVGRMRAVNGDGWVRSEPGNGTTVVLRWPGHHP